MASAKKTSAPKEGDHVNGYTLKKLLGTGTYGEVWLAINRLTRERLAIKFMHSYINQRLALAEAKKMRSVISLHIVRPYPPGKSPHHGRVYIPMEFFEKSLEGELKKLIRSRRRKWISRDMAYQLVLGILQGLKDIHAVTSGRQAHGDIKPGNVLLASDGSPRISDFGAAVFFGEDNLVGLRGSPTWTAPELLDKKRPPPTKESDMFSLGVLAYLLLTGHHPFFCSDHACVLNEDDNIEAWKEGSFEISSPFSINSSLDEDVSKHVMGLLSPDPALRPESFNKLERRLHAILGSPGLPPAPAKPLITTPAAGIPPTPVPSRTAARVPASHLITSHEVQAALNEAQTLFLGYRSPKDALQVLQRVTEQAGGPTPASPKELADCYSFKAYIHNGVGLYSEAVDASSEGLKVDAKHVPSLHTRAWAHFKLGRYKEAAEDARLALAQNVDDRKRSQLELLLSGIERRPR